MGGGEGKRRASAAARGAEAGGPGRPDPGSAEVAGGVLGLWQRVGRLVSAATGDDFFLISFNPMK